MTGDLICGNDQRLTAKLVLGTCTFEEDVELERAIEEFLDRVQVAGGI